MPLLKLSSIESYYGPVMAVQGISLEVEQGDIVTILGANGAGKTTILKTISGVMDPEKGSIEFQGQRIDRLPPEQIVKLGISHVPEGREIFPDLTVRENLMMGAYVRRDRSAIAGDFETVYGHFPILRQRTSQLAGSMSGGEQQMLAMARALMARPKLLLLDEPSLGLSPLLVRELFQIIREINRDQGVTILLVEQNALMALAVASVGYILNQGRIVLRDDCRSLMNNPHVRESYLGVRRAGDESSGRRRGTIRWC
ncbi:MAG: ABC transporter ATP-binding protein [Proteobacteria bacterium]|nr:ABC transporter ATP-binding protein [Pseudomonadota bacterium]